MENASRGVAVSKSSYSFDFARWLAEVLPRLTVHLRINGSARTPGGVAIDAVGVEAVLHAYQWRAEWEGSDGTRVVSLDWPNTKRSLAQLGRQLREAVGSGDDDATLIVCERIIQWGGERNRATGARPFLNRLVREGRLAAYIAQAGRFLSLDHAELPLGTSIELMNSMLTKVHSLYAADGLPIYDSRVAAATSALAEAYRRSAMLNSAMPEELRFPGVGGSDRKSRLSRRVRRLFPEADEPGSVPYASSQATARWTNAKWRAGKVLRSVVRAEPRLLADEGGEAERMHALEAAFFMIGYDVLALREFLA